MVHACYVKGDCCCVGMMKVKVMGGGRRTYCYEWWGSWRVYQFVEAVGEDLNVGAKELGCMQVPLRYGIGDAVTSSMFGCVCEGSILLMSFNVVESCFMMVLYDMFVKESCFCIVSWYMWLGVWD